MMESKSNPSMAYLPEKKMPSTAAKATRRSAKLSELQHNTYVSDHMLCSELLLGIAARPLWAHETVAGVNTSESISLPIQLSLSQRGLCLWHETAGTSLQGP